MVIKFLKESGFKTEDHVWYTSPLKTFNIGIEGNTVVYFNDLMEQSVLIPYDHVTSIRRLLVQEILEV